MNIKSYLNEEGVENFLIIFSASTEKVCILDTDCDEDACKLTFSREDSAALREQYSNLRDPEAVRFILDQRCFASVAKDGRPIMLGTLKGGGSLRLSDYL